MSLHQTPRLANLPGPRLAQWSPTAASHTGPEWTPIKENYLSQHSPPQTTPNYHLGEAKLWDSCWCWSRRGGDVPDKLLGRKVKWKVAMLTAALAQCTPFFFQFYLICEKERKLFSVVNAIWAACPPHPRTKFIAQFFLSKGWYFICGAAVRWAVLRCCAAALCCCLGRAISVVQ